MHPVRNRTGYTLYVRGERRVVLQVICGVVAHNVHNRHIAFLGIVNICQGITQTRSQMQ